MAHVGGRKVHEAPGRHHDHEGRAVVGGVHDGPGQPDQPAIRRLPHGPTGPEDQHRSARAAVHRVVGADAVRADHVGAVPGPHNGRPRQGHVVHGCPGVPGRDRGREHTRRAEQRVHHTAERRLPV